MNKKSYQKRKNKKAFGKSKKKYIFYLHKNKINYKIKTSYFYSILEKMQL